MVFVKSFLISLVFAIIVGCSSNDPMVDASKTVIQKTKVTIANRSFNFGTISLEDSITYSYPVINSGNKNLIIKNVKTSCGCTAPEWEKKPIAPGDSTLIKVKFNPVSTGYNEKTIVINCNVDSSFIVLYLRGTVVK